MWNLLCQYNNIYINTNGRPKKNNNNNCNYNAPGNVANVRKLKKKKKKKRQSASLDFHCRWTVEYVEWTMRKYYSSIAAFYIVNIYEVWTLLLLPYLSL